MKQTLLVFIIVASLLFSGTAQANWSDSVVFEPQSASLAEEAPGHPILNNINLRQAVAYCINKDALIQAAYPALTPAERLPLVSDTFFIKSSWKYRAPTLLYPYDPTIGKNILETSGWILQPGDQYRTKNGRELSISTYTTDSDLRKAYAPVLQSQLAECGIRINLHYLPIDQLLSGQNLVGKRDFESALFAWVQDEEITLNGLYGCDSIPTSPYDDGTKQNVLGWCNQGATDLLIQADDKTKSQSERADLYAQAMEIILDELPFIPLFERHDSGNSAEHLNFNLDLTVKVPTPQSHPIIKNSEVRQAIAHCIDKDALIEAAYPTLTPGERLALVTDTYFDKSHWAYKEPATKYAYDPAIGNTKLDAVGWTIQSGDTYRSKNGRVLALTLKTTDADVRQAYAPQLQSQLAACGIQLTVKHLSSGELFGWEGGVQTRNFELASFAYI